MSDDVVDGEKSILVPHTFNDHEILEVEHQGKPAFLAQQVGSALGYADPSQLAENITRKWSEDFEEGRDYLKLTNGTLAAFKATVNYPSDRRVVDPQARHLILLTESGAQLAAILSRTAQGRAFRRWLVDVVLPERRTAQAELPAPTSPPKRQRGRPRVLPALPNALGLDDLRPNHFNEWQLGEVMAFDAHGRVNPHVGVREHLIWRAVTCFEDCNEDQWRAQVLKGLASALGIRLATFEGDPLLERAEVDRWILRAQMKELLHRMTDLQLVRALAMLARQMGIFRVVSGFPIQREGWRWEPGPSAAEELGRVQAELARVTSELRRISAAR